MRAISEAASSSDPHALSKHIGRKVGEIGSNFIPGLGAASAEGKGAKAVKFLSKLDNAAEKIPLTKTPSMGILAAERAVATGGRKAIPYWDNDAAELAYNTIRSDSGDVAAIARNTGMPEWRVSRIKDHVFFNEHQLDDGLMRFQADPEMANAWSRLSVGNHVGSDIKLLNHEIFEAKFEGIFKTNYRTSHDAAIRSGRVWVPGE